MAKQKTIVVRRDRAQWEQLVAEYEQSGLTRKAFCAAKGLRVSSLGYWRTKLGREVVGTGFVELPALTSRGWEVELALGDGLVLHLRRGA